MPGREAAKKCPMPPPPIPNPKPAVPQIVDSLLGRAQVEMAISCLGSLVTHSADPFRLRLRDDGTLGESDKELLGAALASSAGPPSYVSRAEADDLVAPWLARRPSLARARREHPLFLKLVDLAIPTAGEEVAYCDADVLFLRPFKHLFRFPSSATGAVFMSDVQNAYSVRSWHLLRHRRLRLPKKVNSGLILYRTAKFDPDLLEWYLSRPEFQFAPPWTEQTAWALLGAAAGCSLYDPRQIAIPRAAGPLPAEAVALHFVSPVRGRLLEALPRALDREGEASVEIRTVPTRPLSPFSLAVTEGRRRVRRLRSR